MRSPASLLLWRAPTPRRPSRRTSLPSFDGTAAIQQPETARSPTFPGVPRHACSGSTTPAEPSEQGLRDRLSLRFALRVLPSETTDSSASATTTFRGPIPQPACSLSTLRSPGRPSTRQDSLPAGGPALPDGSSTRWVTLLSFCNVDGHMASSKSELSWRTVSRGSGFSEARRESHIRTQTRRMKSYGSRTCGLESPSQFDPIQGIPSPAHPATVRPDSPVRLIRTLRRAPSGLVPVPRGALR